MDALKYQAIVKDGQLDLPPIDLPEGTRVEAILLIKETPETDETEYLLSTEANRKHLKEALESLENPNNYIDDRDRANLNQLGKGEPPFAPTGRQSGTIMA